MTPLQIDTDIIQAVRRADYERFLAIQRAPAAARPALYVVAAFAVELAQIADTVSEAMLGHIRLAWWREALAEIAAGSTPRKHPLVLALAELYAAHPDIWPLLNHMVDARAADLAPELLASEAQWLEYLNHTAGALHLAFAMVIQPVREKTLDAAILADARAYAMVGLARAIPYHHANGFQRFSGERLVGMKDGLMPSDTLCDFVKALLSDAQAEASKTTYPQTLKCLHVLNRITQFYNRRLVNFSHNPYQFTSNPFKLVWHVFRIG